MRLDDPRLTSNRPPIAASPRIRRGVSIRRLPGAVRSRSLTPVTTTSPPARAAAKSTDRPSAVGHIAGSAGATTSEYSANPTTSTWRHEELLQQGSFKLLEARLANQQPVLGEHKLEDVKAESPSRECGHQDVRVEKDPHETSSKTSSSVANHGLRRTGRRADAVLRDVRPPVGGARPHVRTCSCRCPFGPQGPEAASS